MHQIFRLNCILFFLSTFSFSTFAQTEFLQEQYLPGTSASANNFSNIILDNGRIWVASYDGLLEFDGYSYNNYEDPKHHAIPTDLLGIIKDKNGFIWCCNFPTSDNQLTTVSTSKKKDIAILDPFNDLVIPFEEYIDTSLLKNYSSNISEVYQDNNDDIWIITKNDQAFSFSTKLHKSTFKISKRHERIFTINEDYYKLKKDSIIQFNSNLQRISAIYVPGDHTKIEISPDSILYITSADKANNYNLSLRMLKDGIVSENLLDRHNSNYLTHDFKNAISTIVDSIFITDLGSGVSNRFKSIYPGQLRKVRLLNEENFYFPSSSGLQYLSSTKYPFEIIKDEKNESNRYLTCINDSLLLYSSYSGAKIQNLNTKVIYDHNPSYYFGMAELPGKKLLFGNEYAHFAHLEILADGKIKETRLKDSYTEYLAHRVLFYDNFRDTIWVGSEKNLRMVESINLTENKINTTISQYNLSGIKCFYLKGDTLSIGTINGLYEIYADNSIQKIEESNHFIYDIERRNDGSYYLATQGKGLVIIDAEKNILEIDESFGISDKTVYSLEIDHEGFVWAGTQNGLSMIDPESELIQSYYKKNGLSNNEFNYTSSYIDKKGKFYFGSVDGIISFYPSEIREKRRNEYAKIELIEVKSWDHKIQEFKFVSYKKGDKLIIPSKSRSIKLKLSLDNMSLLMENVFQYKIPKQIDSWKNIQENIIELTNLPAGNHELLIRTKSSLTDNLVIPLQVKQVFYYTWWFLLLSFFLPVFAIRYYFSRSNKIAKLRQKELEEEVQSRTEEIVNKTNELELSNKSKDQIISILAHDLRSPLLSLNDVSKKISYLIEQNRTENLYELGRDINKKSHNLQRLVDNMLHWAVYQSGGKNSVLNTFDINGPILQAIELYIDIAKSKNIKVNYVPMDNVMLYSDLNIFQTIIRNLLDNAIKYSPENSSIEISCITNDSKAEIYVKDQGIGMNTDIIEILNKTDLDDPDIMIKSKGTGLGLSICKLLLQEQNHVLKYAPNKPRGTVFSFTQNLFKE